MFWPFCGIPFGIAVSKTLYPYVDHFAFPRPCYRLVFHLQIHQLVRNDLTPMTALFIISIAVFIYMVYVLLKPENF
ncbi:potassium-transporting ATPase subunit F [Mucilaginibacter myungsuensis]|uniref:Potassium-transporting ATPase subunit F n=1 Tax=Mucilaginibacter myungsuensis TaxID=649104 RepID=A0A929KWJ5_9SPHI|nr:potassium-transporting ATPase subunit F [Mucilaginibacter myungsuensis]